MFILCLGHEGIDTDDRVSKLGTNNGLITDPDFIPMDAGYYHTTVVDLPFGAIVNLAKEFQKVIMLDQPESDWGHWKSLLATYKLMTEIEALGIRTAYKDNENVKKFLQRQEMLEHPSFCIYPWINLVDQNETVSLCSRTNVTVDIKDDVSDWKTNAQANDIRQRLLSGNRYPKHCKTCYYYEDHNVESYRAFETAEWLAKLDINTWDDLETIDRPYYYEIRLGNKCNIMCRSCAPIYSHKIGEEAAKYNLPVLLPDPGTKSDLRRVDINNLGSKSRVYLSGGEPTVIKDVYKFMQECIDAGKTDFELTMATNAVAVSDKFLELTKHFPNANFSISLDGYGKINDYWRWGSDWNTVITNAHKLQDLGHSITINTVPGIYNVTNLHLLFEFLDIAFPHTAVYIQLNYEPRQSAYNHPNAELVRESMRRCMQTNVYHAFGKSLKTSIDSLYNHYCSEPTCDIEMLRKYFEHADQLDKVRGVHVKDYIPELDECRKYL